MSWIQHGTLWWERRSRPLAVLTRSSPPSNSRLTSGKYGVDVLFWLLLGFKPTSRFYGCARACAASTLTPDGREVVCHRSTGGYRHRPTPLHRDELVRATEASRPRRAGKVTPAPLPQWALRDPCAAGAPAGLVRSIERVRRGSIAWSRAGRSLLVLVPLRRREVFAQLLRRPTRTVAWSIALNAPALLERPHIHCVKAKLVK